MAEFIYNNAINANTGYTTFEFICGYHSKVSFKKNVDPYLRSCSANKLAKELRKLIEVCYQNLLYT